MKSARQDYADLMRDFVEGAITAQEFEALYLRRFKEEKRSLDEWTYRILDEVFGHVDAFRADEALFRRLDKENPGWPLTAEQLRSKVGDALARLER